VTAWIVIVSIGAVSYSLRAAALVVVASRPLPESLQLPLGFVGPAAIAALLASLLFTSAGTLRAASVAELIAVGAGIVAVRRTGNMLHAFAVGFPVLWVGSLLGA
jgi:branched-subunit amino acid transport protein